MICLDERGIMDDFLFVEEMNGLEKNEFHRVDKKSYSRDPEMLRVPEADAPSGDAGTIMWPHEARWAKCDHEKLF